MSLNHIGVQHGKDVLVTARHTGWALAHGLRTDIYGECGYAFQSDIGCLDAPFAIPGGTVDVDEGVTARWVKESCVLRDY